MLLTYLYARHSAVTKWCEKGISIDPSTAATARLKLLHGKDGNNIHTLSSSSTPLLILAGGNTAVIPSLVSIVAQSCCCEMPTGAADPCWISFPVSAPICRVFSCDLCSPIVDRNHIQAPVMMTRRRGRRADSLGLGGTLAGAQRDNCQVTR